MRDPKPIGDLVRVLMERYRLADPDTWTRIRAEWDTLGGHPWAGRSKPRSLKDGELVVEAVTPGVVSILRYGTESLVGRLAEELGPGVVTSVRVVAPARH
jgi:predicted nucleic acid-binding Zn ribbon protein